MDWKAIACAFKQHIAQNTLFGHVGEGPNEMGLLIHM
jgi:hypothetical protein